MYFSLLSLLSRPSPPSLPPPSPLLPLPSPPPSSPLLPPVPPRYSPDQVTYIVIEGSSPLLTLTLSAFPEVTQYTWTKGGVTIQTTPTRTLSPDGIAFSGVSRDDSGTYTVQTSSGGGVATIDMVVYCE